MGSPITQNEKDYLNELDETLYQTRERYRDATGATKLEIAEEYNKLVEKKSEIMKKILTDNLVFSEAEIESISSSAKDIEQAAETQQVVSLVAGVLVKYIDFT